MKIFLYFILSICVWQSALAQNGQIDSLKNVLENYKKHNPAYEKDTVYIKQLLDLGILYSRTDNEKAVNELAQTGIKLAENANFYAGQGLGWLILAHFYGAKGDFDKTLQYATKATQKLEKTTQIQRLQYAKLLIPKALTQKGQYKEALQYLLALKDFQEKVFRKDQQNENYHQLYVELARVYMYLEDRQKANEYIAFVIDNTQKKDRNYANAREFQINYLMEDKKYALALAYQRELIDIYQKPPSSPAFLVVTKMQMAHTYKLLGKIDSAKIRYLQCMELATQINRLNIVNLASHALARTYMEQDSLPKALDYAHKAADLSKELGYKKAQMVDAGLLAELYAKAKDFEKAYHYHNQNKALSDELTAETNNKEIGRIEAKYDYAQKETELLRKQEIQKLQNEQLEKNVLLQTSEKEKLKAIDEFRF